MINVGVVIIKGEETKYHVVSRYHDKGQTFLNLESDNSCRQVKYPEEDVTFIDHGKFLKSKIKEILKPIMINLGDFMLIEMEYERIINELAKEIEFYKKKRICQKLKYFLGI